MPIAHYHHSKVQFCKPFPVPLHNFKIGENRWDGSVSQVNKKAKWKKANKWLEN